MDRRRPSPTRASKLITTLVWRQRHWHTPVPHKILIFFSSTAAAATTSSLVIGVYFSDPCTIPSLRRTRTLDQHPQEHEESSDAVVG